MNAYRKPPVESLNAFQAVDAAGRRVWVQTYPLDGVIHGVRADEGLCAYEVEDDQGEIRIIMADGPERAMDLARYALTMALRRPIRPVGQPRCIGPCELHPTRD
ncbi:hypothetical protein WV31_10275 [Magnetospirillum sp. ME-1]|uniref:hypothetical protein n=1 Tax=Magnetospirillum sp. ME-1 TaxID=1639348 RepID=UPI000A17E8D0|nr:hypothetical protein [Magnetospirillum sp. ME-1]ARJ66012.1 hypothetical protein WV31_10275 [Magnetospirillum sp. ME-1]